ncbi:hypothetical protein AB0K60_07175 [Thermopolyspora sp. NPDC052614]|uniref:hypothetical protein n=1 Tax=Thermopolyspora sp. NPDC052614 TaxID=3155682 RepID=UPI00341C927C
MPLIPGEYRRQDLERIAREETAKAAGRAELGHTWAADRHRGNAAEAMQMIADGEYGRRSGNHQWR